MAVVALRVAVRGPLGEHVWEWRGEGEGVSVVDRLEVRDGGEAEAVRLPVGVAVPVGVERVAVAVDTVAVMNVRELVTDSVGVGDIVAGDRDRVTVRTPLTEGVAVSERLVLRLEAVTAVWLRVHVGVVDSPLRDMECEWLPDPGEP